ncbi:MAG: tryptophanase [Deltaproteobacteria bacterium]|nr:tryptophanase [Deltaproteobacteria bacterium]
MTFAPPAHEPHKTKTVRPIAFPSLEERKRHLAGARFNVLNLTQSQVSFDMSSLGTSAMSQEQLAGQLVGDEAYAGAVSFERLEAAVRDVFGFAYVTPAHNALGCVKLVAACFVPPGTALPSNARGRLDQLGPRDVAVPDVRDAGEPVFTGNVDLARLAAVIAERRVSLVGMQCFADGQHPFSLKNLRAVRALADRHGLKLVLDASRIIENAWYIQRHEPGQDARPIADIAHEIARCAHLFQMDGAQDPRCNTGAFLATDNPGDAERLMNEVVVYEGLHTYGGMAGRTMEVLARGLVEMVDELEVRWVMHQTERFTRRLLDAGVPLERGCDGAYLKVDAFVPHLTDHRQHAIAAALYLASGVCASASGLVGRDALLPVQIPRLAMTNEQLDQVADAIALVHRQRDRITGLELVEGGAWHDQLEFHGVFAPLTTYAFDTMPYLVHTYEKVGALTREQREQAMRKAGYNTFLLRSADVTIDLLTDSGTSAMSTEQWAAYDATRATSARSDEYVRLIDTLRDVLGYRFILPTHQGRAAEHIMSQAMIRPGQWVPGNMYFTTTKLHQELAGGRFIDVIVDEAHDPESEHAWKGNVDLGKLAALVEREGRDAIAYLSFELSVNMAGGQPVSMDNIKEVYAWCSARRIPVFFDATRVVENAYMIQQRDPRYRDVKVRDIVGEIMAHGDGCTISGKKDFLINIGGVLAYRDNAQWAAKSEELLRIHEGGVFDGGLAIADLACIARGVTEMLDDRYIRARVRQTEALGRRLREAGVPIVMPSGTHAIFIDARRFLPHVDQDAYPAQRLAAELFIETGVRAMERGNVSKGRDPEGKNYRPALELVRLTLSRRVYSNDHMDAVAAGVIRLFERRHTIQGLTFTYEPAHLRFFQARFAPL